MIKTIGVAIIVVAGVGLIGVWNLLTDNQGRGEISE
jgi:hypothetical protein